MKGPTTIIQEGNLSVPGQAKHQRVAVAKEQPSLTQISLPGPPILETLSGKQAFHDTQCFKEDFKEEMVGKSPVLKALIFPFNCSSLYIKQYKSSTQSSNLDKLPVSPAT